MLGGFYGTRPGDNVMDGNTNFYDFVELHGKAWENVGVGGTGASPAEGGDPRPANASYLETSEKDSGGKNTEQERYVLHAVGCRSWFCPYCCIGRGLAFRKRLIEVVSTFKGLLMWTLTVDPKLFANPQEAFH